MAKRRKRIKINDELIDAAVRHSVLLERLKVGEARAVVRSIETEVVPALERVLSRRTGAWSTARLLEVIGAARTVVKAGMTAIGRSFSRRLDEFAMSEAERNSRTVSGVLPVGIDMRTPSVQLVRETLDRRPLQSAPMSSWLPRVGSDAANAIAKQIRIGVASGESVDEIARRILGDGGARSAFQGEVGKMKRDATTVVRTSINHASAQAREASFAANADVISGVMIVATLDERTTETCQSLDGKVFPVGEGPRPPFHWNCRTTTTPVTKSWRQIREEAGMSGDDDLASRLDSMPAGDRASMTGAVPATLDYPTWLSRQDPEIQRDILGSDAASLASEGSMRVVRFVDRSGKTTTISSFLRSR